MNDEVLDLEPKKVNTKEIVIWKRIYFILSSVYLIKIISLALFTVLTKVESPLVPYFSNSYEIGFLFIQNIAFFGALAVGQILIAFNWMKIASILLILSIGITTYFGVQMAIDLVG
jgi:hypothetical protein